MSASGNHTHSAEGFTHESLFAQLYVWLEGNRKRFKKIALGLALTLFCSGLFFSLRAHPDIFRNLSLAPVLLIFFLSLPAGIAASAVDFQTLARLTGVKVAFFRAVEIVIFTRAANMLPVPGSFAVRMGALKMEGVNLKHSGKLMVVFTLVWAGIGFGYSAVWLSMQAPLLWTFVATGLGVTFFGAAVFGAYVLSFPWEMFARVTLLRFALVALDALSLMFAFQAIGVGAGYEQTAILVAAGFMSCLVPAGIGVREAAIAAISPAAGIDPGAGFLAATVSRLTGMAFLALGALVAALASQRHNG